MSKKMMVNATHPEENRVAIVEDGILTELDIEVAGREPTKGNIYKAVVVRVESGLQAAFVDYGAERLGFLQIDEINYKSVKPDYKPAEDGRRPRINELLQRGQELLVQITKEERGTKGAALTTYLSLAGRYMVLMPGSQTRGVSRKAESDSQRKELKKAMSSLDLADGVGYIVRTAALDQTREELERDYRYLIRLFESIKELEQKSKAPILIYKESNLIIRSIRDYFTTDMDEVLIDDAQVFREAKDFFQMVMPDQVKLVKLHQERRPIFSRYQIEDQIETLNRNQVSLPSGGSIVIDPTEALVAIDVNSGKMASEQGVEATATKTNLEAATEVGRQLRLRDLGGLIVIDFIDMRERKHMRQVEDQVKKALANDKARVSVGRISKFGLLEMSRQRIKATLTQGSHLACPHCNGTGHLKSPETQAVALLRKIHASAAKGQVSRVEAQLPMEVAAYLLNHNREELVEMERRYQLQIHIHGNRDFLADQVEIEIQKKEKEKSTQAEHVAVGTLPMVVDQEPKEESNESTQTEKTEAETAGPAKKRRRRRRRKPAGAATGEAHVTDEATTDSPETVPANEGNEESEKTAGTTAEPTATETPAQKPQRRRRSSSKAKSVADETKTAEAEKSASAAEVPLQPGQPESATSDNLNVAEEKPKRPRRRRKPATSKEAAENTNDNVTEQPAKESAASSKAKTEAPQGSQSASDAAEKPKRKRVSRAKPKPATAETATESQGTAEVKPVAKKPVKKAPVKKTAPGEKVAAETPESPEAKPVAEQPVKETPAKRTTRKTPARKAAPKKETTAETATKAPGTTETKPVAEQPVKEGPAKRTTRKTPAKKSAPKKDTTPEAATKAPETTEAKPVAEKSVKKAPAKRATKKTPVKKTAPKKTADEAPSKTTAEHSGDEVPKPKRRRTVKKKTVEVESAEKD